MSDLYAGPKTSPFKVWHIPQVPMKAFVVEVQTLAEAHLLTETLAHYDLFQFENRIKPDYANANGIMEWDVEAGEYYEVEDDDPRLIALTEAA